MLKHFRTDSDKNVMGMLDRYKKKGGFVQLLTLIETSNEKKQEHFLALISAEDLNWEKAIRSRLLTFSKVMSWPKEILMEVISRLTPLTLAGAIHGEDPAWIDEKLEVLPSISRRKITDIMSELKSNAGEKATCQIRILSEVRGFAHQGIIKFEKFEPDLVIPENIEDLLAHPRGLQSLIKDSDKTDAAVSASSNGAGLDFSKADLSPSQGNESFADNSADEIKFLRRRVSALQQEINNLKYENNIMKEKLVQIKKIA